MHLSTLHLNILLNILKNTQTVNPQVFIPQQLRNHDGIPEHLRENCPRDLFVMSLNILLSCFHYFAGATPAVAQCDIFAVLVKAELSCYDKVKRAGVERSYI